MVEDVPDGAPPLNRLHHIGREVLGEDIARTARLDAGDADHGHISAGAQGEGRGDLLLPHERGQEGGVIDDQGHGHPRHLRPEPLRDPAAHGRGVPPPLREPSRDRSEQLHDGAVDPGERLEVARHRGDRAPVAHREDLPVQQGVGQQLRGRPTDRPHRVGVRHLGDADARDGQTTSQVRLDREDPLQGMGDRDADDAPLARLGEQARHVGAGVPDARCDLGLHQALLVVHPGDPQQDLDIRAPAPRDHGAILMGHRPPPARVRAASGAGVRASRPASRRGDAFQPRAHAQATERPLTPAARTRSSRAPMRGRRSNLFRVLCMCITHVSLKPWPTKGHPRTSAGSDRLTQGCIEPRAGTARDPREQPRDRSRSEW